MAIVLKPEVGIPVSEEVGSSDFKERAEAACSTAQELAEHGLDLEPTKEDKGVAAALSTSYAEDPVKTSKKATNKNISKLTPASLVLTDAILQEFGHSVAENAAQIRYLVTNKLLIESENQDPRIRMRALELLGKISDVGLFAEKSEVTVTHQSTDDLRAKLRSKLEKLVEPVEIEDAVVIENQTLNLEEALGEIEDEEYDD
tara:strand:- start:509 stop:1114 length:606 start_codon:yes stop_codon:yes gene_type:complete